MTLRPDMSAWDGGTGGRRAPLTAGDRRRWGPRVRRAAICAARRSDGAHDVQDLCRDGFVAVAEALRDAPRVAPDEPLERYVEHRIQGAMLEALHLASAAARDAHAASRAIAGAIRALARRSPTPATADEIAAALSLSRPAYESMLERIAEAGVARLAPLAGADRGAPRDDAPAVDLVDAIEALPPRERDLLALVHQAEMPIDLAARALGASPRGAVVLLAQAIHRLRAALGE